MKVKVEACWGSHSYYRLTIPYHGKLYRETITAEKWTRKESTAALNLLEHVYGISRASVRFTD